MNIFIVYSHPSENSFTRHVRDELIQCLVQLGHSYEISDLYKMNFCTDISEEEYAREANYQDHATLSEDVIAEQDKINRCDAMVFIYPVFWTEAPAKLVGWFNRVWTYGFAYGTKKMKMLDQCVFLCTTGRTTAHLHEHGHIECMKQVMIGDRFFGRTKSSAMFVFDGMSKANAQLRESNWNKHLNTVHEIVASFGH